ncbi:MAG: quercetin 2,3-dioxygenase, partial [Acidithiobacillus ferrivorans]
MLVLDAAGQEFSIEANSDASVLLLSGEPIDEPIVGYGPFVMNSEGEIKQAIADFNSGRFGEMTP